MSSNGVIITSAINTKFGVYTAEQRLAQTLETIRSVRNYVPGSVIFLIEMAGIPLNTEQLSKLTAAADQVFDYTSDPAVTGLFHSTDNWDVVKNVTEVMCFKNTLKTLLDAQLLDKVDRLFKVSGRYLLTDQFDLEFYNQYKNKSCMVLGTSKSSQFSYEVTQVERQYMSRLWSWPAPLTSEVVVAYEASLQYMYERLAVGGYVDIEHCLYKFLDHNKVIEKDVLGIRGNIAPNGAAIND
jgi:hypothetical protein